MWTLYCDVIVDNQPQRSRDLGGYQLRILQASKKFKWAAAVSYDTEFRQKAARYHNIAWSCVDLDNNVIHSWCFTGQTLTRCCTICKKHGHVAATSVTVPQYSQWKRLGGPTYDAFNTDNCSFHSCKNTYSCSSCGPKHPTSWCDSRK